MKFERLQGPLIGICSMVCSVVLLLLCEFVARWTDLRSVASSTGGVVFDMPTWMLQEDNTASRLKRTDFSPEEIEWLSLFKEGDVFRVSMVPNRELMVLDTFNRIFERNNPQFFVKTNSLGFRSDEPTGIGHPAPVRVAVFGDSSCWGWGVNQDETFASLVRDALRQQWGEQPVEVLNFAIPGDSSEYGRLLVEKYIPLYPPDILILGFGANDAKPVAVPHKEQVARFSAPSLASRFGRFLRVHSVLYAALERMVIQRRRSEGEVSGPKRPAVSPTRFQQNVAKMARLGSSHGVQRTVIVSLCSPANYQRAAGQAAKRVHGAFVNGQEALISSVPKLEELQMYPAEVMAMKKEYGTSLRRDNILYVTADGCHPNVVGHRIVAEQVLSAIQPEKFLKRYQRRLGRRGRTKHEGSGQDAERGEIS